MFLVDFADFAVIYEIKFYMGNHSRINETNDSVRTNVWYELKRQRITIPLPNSDFTNPRAALAKGLTKVTSKPPQILRGDQNFRMSFR